jgi:ABC-type multidrug transport system fused ATPase/permease subunit
MLRIQQSFIQIQVNAGSANPTIELIGELEKIEELQVPNNRIFTDQTGFNPGISIQELSFSYNQGSTLAIDNLSLEIKPGDFVAIVGPSGSGKSTLVDLILGLNAPLTGNILISNLPPEKAISSWPGVIGYVPQDVGIINGTIRENLSLGLDPEDLSETEINRAIEQSGLQDYIENSPLGLNMVVGERGAKLSGGQRQRLGIARALVTSPKLLILDEATSSLDGQSENAISTAIRSLKGSVTLIMIAHRLSTVRFADKVVYIENGKCLSSGTFEEVRTAVPNFEKQAKLMGL